MVLHRTPTEADGAEENRAGSRNVFFIRVLMSVVAAAGSWARASREFQRGVEVMSVSAARVMAIEIGGKKKRKRKRPGNIMGEIFGKVILSKALVLKQLYHFEEIFRRGPARCM